MLRRFRSGPQSDSRGHVSSSRLVKPSVPISRTGLSCCLHRKVMRPFKPGVLSAGRRPGTVRTARAAHTATARHAGDTRTVGVVAAVERPSGDRAPPPAARSGRGRLLPPREARRRTSGGPDRATAEATPPPAAAAARRHRRRSWGVTATTSRSTPAAWRVAGRLRIPGRGSAASARRARLTPAARSPQRPSDTWRSSGANKSQSPRPGTVVTPAASASAASAYSVRRKDATRSAPADGSPGVDGPQATPPA